MLACSHGHWGGRAYGRGRWSSHGQESILESGDIEALLGDDDSTTAFATLNMEHLAPWSAAAGEPREYLPSDSAEPEHFPGPVLRDHQSERGATGARLPAPPLPGTAAAQVAQAFGRRLTVQSGPSIAERQAGPPSSVPRTLPSTDMEEPDLAAAREASLAPPPGAAAAAVARAFAKMSTAERSHPQPNDPFCGGHAPSATAVRSATAAPDEPSTAAACGHAGYCALQREGSVPPTPGVAAAQVASAFARLRSRSNSPRDSDAAADAHKSDDNSCAAQHLDRAPCQAFNAGACNAEATCGASDAASQGSSEARDGPRRGASMAGRHNYLDHQAEAIQETPESSGAGFEHAGDGQACEGARGSAIGELDGTAGGEVKAPGRQGKGKERAGSSAAKTWTEVCPPQQPSFPQPQSLSATAGLCTRHLATAYLSCRVTLDQCIRTQMLVCAQWDIACWSECNGFLLCADVRHMHGCRLGDQHWRMWPFPVQPLRISTVCSRPGRASLPLLQGSHSAI